jgi:hypothetical protein
MKSKLHLLLSIFLLACLGMPVARAQTAIDRPALYSQIDSLFADTGLNPITPADMRTAFKSVVASALVPLTDGTPAAGSHTHLASAISDSTAIGRNFMKLPDPGSIVFVRINADNTISVLDAASYRAAIGAGTSSFDGSAASLTGLLDPARLGTGTGLQVLRRNAANNALEFATISAGGGDLLASNNLSDLVSAATARSNLGLGSLATQNGTFSGASSGTNTGDQNLFSSFVVSGQPTVTTATPGQALTLVAGTNVTLTTDNTAKSITINAAGGGGTPGGSSGQVQFNNAGSLGGFTLGGDATLNTGTGALTLATANSNVGSFGSATQVGTFTVDAKGRITAAGNTTVTPAVGSLTQSGATTNQVITWNGSAWAPADASGGGNVATDVIFDAKGDLVVGTGADAASKLPVGTNGYVLTADSAQATGVKWAAAGAGTSQRTYAVVIAASDSVSTSGADYVCDGTDDDVQIQAAIDAVSTAGGGTVLLREGHYNYTANPILPKNNVTVRGEGRTNTFLVPSWSAQRAAFGNGTNGGAFTSSTPLVNFELRDLTIDCTSASYTSYATSVKGIFIQYLRNCVFDNIAVLESFATSIGIDYLDGVRITNIYVKNHGRGMNPAGSGVGGNGIGIGTGGWSVESCLINNVVVSVDNGFGNNGIMFEDQNNVACFQNSSVSNFSVIGSYSGLRASGVENLSFANGSIRGTTVGILITDGINNNGKQSKRLRFSNITVSSASTYGMRILGAAFDDGDFNNLRLENCTSNGALIDTAVSNLRFTNLSLIGNGARGIYFISTPTGIKFVNSFASGNTLSAFELTEAVGVSWLGGRIIGTGAGGASKGIFLDGVQGPVRIEGVEISDFDDYGIHAKSVNRTAIVGNHIHDNGDVGVYFDNSSTASYNLFAGNHVYNNGLIGAKTYRLGVRLAGNGMSYSDFINNVFFDTQGTKTQRYAFALDGTRSNIVIRGNDVRNQLTGAITFTTTNSTEVVKDNIGFQPQGPASITVGASPYTYTAGNTPEMVYIYGGTVSDVSKSSSTIGTATGLSVRLEPNEAVTVTYSAAPTMRKDRL